MLSGKQKKSYDQKAVTIFLLDPLLAISNSPIGYKSIQQKVSWVINNDPKPLMAKHNSMNISKKIKFFVRAFLTTLTLSLLPFTNSCSKEEVGFEKTNDPPEKMDNDIVIHNFKAQGSDENQVLWNLSSKKAFVNKITGMVDLHSVDLRYYNKKGQHTRIRSRKGKLNQENRIMILTKKVHVTSHNRRQLFSEKLTWNEPQKLLTTTAAIKVLFPNGDQLTGRGLRADMSLNKILILGGKGVVLPKNTK